MSPFAKFNPVEQLKRWLRSRAELLRQVDTLTQENERLRAKVAELRNAKGQAERSLEERRREKKVLQATLAEQKKASETKERVVEQMGSKLAELRDENDRLQQTKKPGTERS